jgi:Mlc titration factor MtfA (ptsG expression regulator)
MGLSSFFKARRRRIILAQSPIPGALWARAWKSHPILHRLAPKDARRLKEMATIFQAEKEFTPLRNMVIEDEMRLSIAVQAVLPVLKLGLEWLDDFSTVFIVPREYKDLRKEWDGVVMNEYSDELSGEATEYGPLILSWKDVEASGWGDGYNVVIHEIAHKLDYSNEAMDGCPYLESGQDPARWKSVFSAAFADLQERVARRPPLDPYAAESPSEFFAVACEEFFERPARLRRYYKDLYEELAVFFKQDPAGKKKR